LVGDDDEITGVVDWANAASGHPDFDRARTWSILTLDPAAVARRDDPRWTALVDGWLEAGGLHDLGSGEKAWACRYMLDDLAERCDRDQLVGIEKALLRLSAPSASRRKNQE
jgi:aminoglycoside phosphotransferase (APT) family kinase protein